MDKKLMAQIAQQAVKVNEAAILDLVFGLFIGEMEQDEVLARLQRYQAEAVERFIKAGMKAEEVSGNASAN